ncbi:MAG TPA: hypothetical protein VFF68_03015 [Anaerolineaceae bacterium]|nr:hypothetical protein [Anaerolineaceae bacterium]
MAKTSTRVSFGLYALELKQDSSPVTATPLQPFSKVQDLRTDNASSRPYASFEPDFWLLDGGYKFLPADPVSVHVGLMSLEMSDAAGVFADPPVLTVAFQQVHTADGLTLRFSNYTGDYASSVAVAYYDAAEALIREDTYAVGSTEFSTGQEVANIKKIVITFQTTNRPYRYLRLAGIDYGELISFEGTSIKAAAVIEETDPLSAELRVNALDLTIFSQDAQFSIINPEGHYAALQERQPLAVYEVVDNQSVYIGTFYLDEWENQSDTVSLFHAVDLVGVLDRQPYRGGIWLGAGIALEDLLEVVLGSIYVPYELDAALVGTVITGWLPAGSVREALQQLAFAVGASVSCARSGSIKIYKTKVAADEPDEVTITRSQMGQGSPLALRSQVTGVEVTAHNYVAGTEDVELYDDTLAAGTHEIVFSEPAHSLSATGATISESGANYAVLEVAAPGAVVLSGKRYIDTTSVTRITTADLTAGVRPNVLKITDAYLVSNTNVAAVAGRVYAYFQQRYRQRMRLFAPAAEVGQVVVVDTLYSKQIRGLIEKMSIDLAGGFVAEVEVVGVQNE